MGRKMTLGSLFDGSGGFPLGAFLTGIQPAWASEVEPFPIRVTTKRLPDVKHLGDINKIDGSLIPPVDIITAGFCCQDLSVAGKRAGLRGQRSGLFYQIPRIIKEMRAATNNEYPKFAVLENVPGMYSSGGGADFQEVLNELARIKDETLSVPMPEKGKWSTSGEIVGDGFSIGWRTLDAQFWGVAQRRRRCYLVVDFTGEGAGQILFDESRLSGNPAAGGNARQAPAGDIAAGVGNAVAFEPGACSRVGGHIWENHTGALRADAGDNQTAVVYDARGNGDGETAGTITGDHNGHISDYTALAVVAVEGNGSRPSHRGDGWGGEVSFTLNSVERHSVCYQDKVGALCASDYKFPQNQQIEGGKAVVEQVVSDSRYVVRRLTPTECAMLQGFPPDWCADLETPEPTEENIAFWSDVWETHRKILGTSSKPKSRNQIVKWLKAPHSDAAEYKMWGNGVALPCVVFILGGIVSSTQR